jgi:hypothetical protein
MESAEEDGREGLGSPEGRSSPDRHLTKQGYVQPLVPGQ